MVRISRRFSLDKVCRDNPRLECSVCSHELPMCVRWHMRVGMCVCARVRRKCSFVLLDNTLKLRIRFIKQS
jgi:hypothetical protein